MTTRSSTPLPDLLEDETEDLSLLPHDPFMRNGRKHPIKTIYDEYGRPTNWKGPQSPILYDKSGRIVRYPRHWYERIGSQSRANKIRNFVLRNPQDQEGVERLNQEREKGQKRTQKTRDNQRKTKPKETETQPEIDDSVTKYDPKAAERVLRDFSKYLSLVTAT